MRIGNGQIALDLFRGALEAKLQYERSIRPSRGAVVQDNNPLFPIQRCVTPDCVSTAESHLSQMSSNATDAEAEDGISPTSGPSQDQDIQRFTSAMTGEGPEQSGTVVPEESRGYCPYFYRTPFDLSDTSRTSTELTSAIIVFNLGLVHHHEWRNSPKAAAFYEISAALLSSEPDTEQSVLLKIALLNNFGIWCYENGDGESLRTCMEHLSTVVENSSIPLAPEIAEGVRRNVQWLLTPPNGGSPAA